MSHDPGCKQLVLKRMAQQNLDVRFNPVLRKACSQDIPKFCLKVCVHIWVRCSLYSDDKFFCLAFRFGKRRQRTVNWKVRCWIVWRRVLLARNVFHRRVPIKLRPSWNSRLSTTNRILFWSNRADRTFRDCAPTKRRIQGVSKSVSKPNLRTLNRSSVADTWPSWSPLSRSTFKPIRCCIAPVPSICWKIVTMCQPVKAEVRIEAKSLWIFYNRWRNIYCFRTEMSDEGQGTISNKNGTEMCRNARNSVPVVL